MDKVSYQDNRFLNIKRLDFVIVLSGLVILYALLSIYYLPPEDAVARVHDYLECIFSIYKIRAELSGFFIDYGYEVQQIFNGIPLNITGLSDFNVGANMYLFFEPFNAYVINQFLFRTLGFIGLLLLLKDHVLPKGSYFLFIAVCTALAFGVLNHLPTRFGTILYQPLLYWSILNIYSGSRKLRDIIFIVAYSFLMGSVFRGGFVGISIVCIVAFYSWVINHRNKKIILIAAIASVVSVILVESRMLYQYLLADFDSARISLVSGDLRSLTLSEAFYQFISHFMYDGSGHHIQGQRPFIFWIVISGLCVIFYRWRLHLKGEGLYKKLSKRLVIIFSITVTISLIWGFWGVIWGPITKLMGVDFNVVRINALSPILWHVMFAISTALLIINYGGLARKVIVPFLLLVVVAYASQQQLYGVKQEINKALGVMENVPLRETLKSYITGRPIDSYFSWRAQSAPYVPLKEFFRVDSFDSINNDMSGITRCSKSDYRVMSFDMAPTITQFHGFYTLDGSVPDVSLEYAEEFRRLFYDELAKDQNQDILFPKKLYTYVSKKSRKPNGIAPTFDMCQFLNMGGRFVFSSKPILNASDIYLSLEASYENLKPSTPGGHNIEKYDAIYLYKAHMPLDCEIKRTLSRDPLTE